MQNFILNKAKYVTKLLQAKSNMAADRYLEFKKPLHLHIQLNFLHNDSPTQRQNTPRDLYKI